MSRVNTNDYVDYISNDNEKKDKKFKKEKKSDKRRKMSQSEYRRISQKVRNEDDK